MVTHPAFLTVTLTTLVSFATLVSLIVGIIGSVRAANRSKARSIDAKNKLEEVHGIVNSRYDDLVKYVKTLSAVLEKADISVPSPFDRGEIENDKRP